MQDWQEKPVDDGLTDLWNEVNKVFPRFGSTRGRQELECLKLVRQHLAHLNSKDTIDASDPLRLRGLLRSVAAQGGSVSPRQTEYARAILDQMDDVISYLEGWVEALKTLATISTVVAASRLVALSQSFEASGTPAFEGRDYSKLVTFWDGFQAGLSLPEESITVPSYLGDSSSWPGADCGVVPPADGSAPPRELQELGSRYVSEAYRMLSGTHFRFESEEESRTYAPLVKGYWNQIQWYIERGTDATQAEDDVDGSLSDCLIELQDVLNPIAESDGVEVASHFTHETSYSYARFINEFTRLFGYEPETYAQYSYDAVYYYAYAIQQAQSTDPVNVKLQFIGVRCVSVEESLDESAFNWVNNVEHWDGEESDFTNPDQVDGNRWPVIESIPISAGPWLELPYDCPPAPLAFDFILWRTTRKLSHIDYRFRRMGDETVIKEFRHEVTPDGRIALGQNVSVYDLRNDEDIHQSYVLHAIPIDEANHPYEGTCNVVHIKWVPSTLSGDGGGDTVVDLNEFAKGREALESGGTIPYNGPSGYIDFSGDERNAHQSVLQSVIYPPKGAICWEEDIPPGNIYIRPSFSEYRAYRIVPETLCISTSSESIRITNEDSSRHRFRTTDNSHFGILGAVGGIKGERAIDTGWLDPGDEVVITLPTGLPSPYWFNLIEVDWLGNPKTENPRMHIVCQNGDCSGDG